MRTKLALAVVACLAGGWQAAPALAAPCGLPDAAPLWIDYAEGTVSFRNELFGRTGVIAATSGTMIPGQLRARGALTVYWQMNMRTIVGTPSAPADPATVPPAANALFDRAVSSSACATPLIGLEELSGANLKPPWSATNAQYRANVLALVQLIAQRGGRPFLFVHGNPYVGGEAGDWWRAIGESADVAYEAYYDARRISALGPLLGNRRLRMGMRRVVRLFAGLGLPAERLGLMLGFQSGPGALGREGLQPLSAWLDFVKWNALAARQVAADEGVGSVWSWGWGTFNQTGADPDKPVAACTYLWTRDASLCDGPGAARGALDTSLTEGQIVLPDGVQCGFPGGVIRTEALEATTQLTGDDGTAATALFGRAVQRRAAPVHAREVVRAERRIVARRFGGSRTAYRAALRRRGLSLAFARGVIVDELRVRRLSLKLRRAARQTVRAWTLARETRALAGAVCLRDELPTPGLVDLSRYARFLRL